MSEQEILDATAQLVEFDAVEAGLAELRKDLAGVQFDVTTTKGDKAARAARQRCVSIRTSADAAYKDWNQPMLEKQRSMRAKLNEIKDAVEAVEEPIDKQIKHEEARKAEEKAERDRIDAEKNQVLQTRIDGIKQTVMESVGKDSISISAMIDFLGAVEVTLEDFGDRAGEAEIAKQHALSQLELLRTAAVEREAAQAKLEADRALLARQQEEQAKEAAEAKAKADAEHAERQAELKRQQDAQKAKEAAAKVKADADEAARKAELAKQQANLQAQQAEIDRQRKEVEDEKAAAAKAEQTRLDAIAAQAKAQADAKAAKEKAEAQAAADAKAKEDADKAAEAARRERVQFEKNGPGLDAILHVLSTTYSVDKSVVSHWLDALYARPAKPEALKAVA